MLGERSANARGRLPATSAKPPVLIKGCTSLAANRIFLHNFRTIPANGGRFKLIEWGKFIQAVGSE